jgi:hypothetical protein
MHSFNLVLLSRIFPMIAAVHQLLSLHTHFLFGGGNVIRSPATDVSAPRQEHNFQDRKVATWQFLAVPTILEVP